MHTEHPVSWEIPVEVFPPLQKAAVTPFLTHPSGILVETGGGGGSPRCC